MAKYAKIESDVVKIISYQPAEGFVEVADNVFADMVLQDDGSYDYTDEFKTEHQPVETYADKRKKEYPPITDQLDYIYHNGVTKWKTDMITPVKEKYPKPD